MKKDARSCLLILGHLWAAILLFGVDLLAQTPIRLGTGTGNTSTSSPISPRTLYYHGQFLYTAAEIQAQGMTGPRNITRFGWFVDQSHNEPIKNFELRMWLTQDADVSTYEPIPGSPLNKIAPLVSLPVYMVGPDKEYDLLNLSTPFSWDGTSNIKIDVCYEVEQTNSSGRIGTYASSPTNHNRYQGRNETELCDVPTNTSTTKLRAMMLFCCYARDVELLQVINPVTNKIFKAGPQPVQVRFRNNGSSTLDSVQIGWKVNGVSQDSFIWRGNLAPMGISDTVTIGVYDFVFNPNFYDLDIWTKQPNGGSDELPLNDTLKLQNLSPGLEGIYTLGDSSRDFISFDQALNVLAVAGVAGHVTFKVKDTVYNLHLDIQPIKGASDTSTITFESDSGRADSLVITYKSANSGNAYTIRLNGADYVTFKDMTIVGEGNGTNFSRVIFLTNQANNNQFINTRIRSLTTGTFSEAIFFNSGGGDNNRFFNNRIQGGRYGVYARSNSSNVLENTEIVDNYFSNQSLGTIDMDYHRGFTIEGNEIWSSSASTADFYGLYINNSNSESKNPSRIINNMIALKTIKNQAVRITNSSYLNIYHNNLRILGGDSTTSAYYQEASLNIKFINNIVLNDAGGYAMNIRTVTPAFESDHNCLYTKGKVLAYWGANRNGINEWRTATALDARSISMNPQFLSDSNLHSFSPGLDAKAKKIEGVDFDFDGQPRDSIAPDIGADEFTIGIDRAMGSLLNPKNGDTLLQGLQYTITVKVANLGTEDQFNFNVGYLVNSGDTVLELILDTLKAGKSMEYSFVQKWKADSLGSHTLYYFVSTLGDPKPKNNSAQAVVFVKKPVGLDDQYLGSRWSVYPNPTGSFVWIKDLKVGPKDQDMQWVLLDELGRVHVPEVHLEQNLLRIDLGEFSPGLYKLILNNDNPQHRRSFSLIKKY